MNVYASLMFVQIFYMFLMFVLTLAEGLCCAQFIYTKLWLYCSSQCSVSHYHPNFIFSLSFSLYKRQEGNAQEFHGT
jgi:hypothetical protein